MEVDPPCFLTINGDQLIYCLGRIAWYMDVGGELFWVTNPGIWSKLPDPETLEQIRRVERHRLEAYLRASRPAVGPRVPPVPRVPTVPSIPVPPPKPPGTDYKQLAEEFNTRGEAYDRDEQRRRDWAKLETKRHNDELRALAQRIEHRWAYWRNAGVTFALAFIDDHDYIEAMFALYSQGRSRLL